MAEDRDLTQIVLIRNMARVNGSERTVAFQNVPINSGRKMAVDIEWLNRMFCSMLLCASGFHCAVHFSACSPISVDDSFS